MLDTLSNTRAALARGTLSAVALAQRIESAIAAPHGQGSRTYISVNTQLRHQARLSDLRRSRREPSGVLEGIALSLKDGFDQAGQVTKAGSRALAWAMPAHQDATVVQRLAAAGALFTGRTNMTEFAFSALGLNPHFGTPLSPYDRETGRIPGGSSAGAAVSVSDGMAVAAIGTDTGGSVRIPAAFCGLVGFKPTAKRIPHAGVFPLAPSLDSVGSIARSVTCCATLDSVMAGHPERELAAADLRGLRLLLPANFVLDGVESVVAHSFERVLTLLSQAGAIIVERPLPTLAESMAFGGIYTREAWLHHQPVLAAHTAAYDPRVRIRVEGGAAISERTHLDLQLGRAKWAAHIGTAMADCAALIMPTTPMVAPALAPLEACDELYHATNLRAMRNAKLFNLLEGCAVSIPCHVSHTAPVGLMIGAGGMADHQVLSIALAVESLLARHLLAMT
ncbi:amidase [Variovorax paradoxus]|uniref:amidase n=1 Tax=Variovorax paradoxus TaxID=34073 RepID=UPI0027819A0C|nr:amidase [Variovorax paradoxus]MDP9927831.1 aspartyl-tRNA(Asn)/glutamyl-tRNA(Gln) amidotransferase subunit A [Variovorax paradoxus]